MPGLLHYLFIVFLGLVEGITEFLPISSTGHLLIVEGLCQSREPDVFNVVIQSGAILAVVFIYWHKIVALFSHLYQAESRDYLFKIIVAFLITASLSYLVVKRGFHLPETLTPIAWATLLGGLVILLMEIWLKGGKFHDRITWLEACLMGLAQVLAAIFPGCSRSGATIMTGLGFGLKRPQATEFSFLLGIPTMFLASGYELYKNRLQLEEGGSQLLVDIVLGFLVSLVVAFFVVKWLLHYVQGHTFLGFAYYRIVLGLLLLLGLASHFIPELGAPEPGAPASAAVVTPLATPVDINGNSMVVAQTKYAFSKGVAPLAPAPAPQSASAIPDAPIPGRSP